MLTQAHSKDLVEERHINQLAYCSTCIFDIPTVSLVLVSFISHLIPIYLFLFFSSAVLNYFLAGFLNQIPPLLFFHLCTCFFSPQNSFFLSATSLLINIPFTLQILIFVSLIPSSSVRCFSSVHLSLCFSEMFLLWVGTPPQLFCPPLTPSKVPFQTCGTVTGLGYQKVKLSLGKIRHIFGIVVPVAEHVYLGESEVLCSTVMLCCYHNSSINGQFERSGLTSLERSTEG